MELNYRGLILFVITSVFLSGMLAIIFEKTLAIHMVLMFAWGFFIGPQYCLKQSVSNKKDE